jgi:hypothetical protein
VTVTFARWALDVLTRSLPTAHTASVTAKNASRKRFFMAYPPVAIGAPDVSTKTRGNSGSLAEAPTLRPANHQNEDCRIEVADRNFCRGMEFMVRLRDQRELIAGPFLSLRIQRRNKYLNYC